MALKFSSHALDMIATHLSKFDEPTIPELELDDDKTLENNILESTLGVLGGGTNAHVRHLVTNVVRRVFASIETYRLGKEHALDYVNGDRLNRLRPYFRALTFFESCVSYSWQTADLFRQIGGERLFQPGDGSEWERLHAIYTYGTKHSFQDDAQDAPPEMPTTIWLTNDGVACIAGAAVSFPELAAMITVNNNFFYDVQERAISKQNGQKKD